MVRKNIKVRSSDELQQTTYMIQKLIGKLLNHSDMLIIVNLKKIYGLDYSEVELVFKHCIKSGNRNISYIEKVAIAFAEKDKKELKINNTKIINEIQRSIMPQRMRLDDKKTTKVTMPYLPFEEKLTDEEVIESKMLENIEMRIQIKNEVEKETMLEILKYNFDIREVSNIFEYIEGSKTIKFFNVFVTKKVSFDPNIIKV